MSSGVVRGKYGAELPEDVSGSGAVVVVNFDEPILVTDGDDEVAVVLGIDDGVGVGPVRIAVGTAVGVQMVELIPGPDGLRSVIGIVAADVFHVAEIDDDVAGRGRAIGEGFRGGGEDDRCGRWEGRQSRGAYRSR